MSLALCGSIDLPRHARGGFDHGDVHMSSGRVYVAHTAAGTVEIIDGAHGRHRATVAGCAEASGVLCAQDDGLVFAAARGAGKVLILGAIPGTVLGEVGVGPRPNGLAWDARRKHVLVADVQDLNARLVDPNTRRMLAGAVLPGRPRWCVYDRGADRFLINVRDPACVAVLTADTLEERARWPVSSPGPHGLDLDLDRGLAFVASDGGMVCVLGLGDGRELATLKIAGEPDAIWHNPKRNRLYVAIGTPGVIDVIDTERMVVAEELATEEGAHTTAFDHARQRLYVFLPRTCRAAVYDET